MYIEFVNSLGARSPYTQSPHLGNRAQLRNTTPIPTGTCRYIACNKICIRQEFPKACKTTFQFAISPFCNLQIFSSYSYRTDKFMAWAFLILVFFNLSFTFLLPHYFSFLLHPFPRHFCYFSFTSLYILCDSILFRMLSINLSFYFVHYLSYFSIFMLFF